MTVLQETLAERKGLGHVIRRPSILEGRVAPEILVPQEGCTVVVALTYDECIGRTVVDALKIRDTQELNPGKPIYINNPDGSTTMMVVTNENPLRVSSFMHIDKGGKVDCAVIPVAHNIDIISDVSGTENGPGTIYLSSDPFSKYSGPVSEDKTIQLPYSSSKWDFYRFYAEILERNLTDVNDIVAFLVEQMEFHHVAAEKFAVVCRNPETNKQEVFLVEALQAYDSPSFRELFNDPYKDSYYGFGGRLTPEEERHRGRNGLVYGVYKTQTAQVKQMNAVIGVATQKLTSTEDHNSTQMLFVSNGFQLLAKHYPYRVALAMFDIGRNDLNHHPHSNNQLMRQLAQLRINTLIKTIEQEWQEQRFKKYLLGGVRATTHHFQRYIPSAEIRKLLRRIIFQTPFLRNGTSDRDNPDFLVTSEAAIFSSSGANGMPHIEYTQVDETGTLRPENLKYYPAEYETDPMVRLENYVTLRPPTEGSAKRYWIDRLTKLKTPTSRFATSKRERAQSAEISPQEANYWTDKINYFAALLEKISQNTRAYLLASEATGDTPEQNQLFLQAIDSLALEWLILGNAQLSGLLSAAQSDIFATDSEFFDLSQHMFSLLKICSPNRKNIRTQAENETSLEEGYRIFAEKIYPVVNSLPIKQYRIPSIRNLLRTEFKLLTSCLYPIPHLSSDELAGYTIKNKEEALQQLKLLRKKIVRFIDSTDWPPLNLDET